MKKNFIIILLAFFQSLVFAQDKKVMKIAKYIEKGKVTDAKELLDELDSKKEYQSDIYYWYVRTVYYRNLVLDNTNSTTELAEARKSFEKLVEFNKKDSSKTFSQYIPQIKKDLYEGKNQITKSEISSQSGTDNQANDGKTITLTQIGQGKTKDEAKYSALRNALEKAFGTFISSNTTIFNDELVKDEIFSVSTGNIQNFEILSETKMPDGSFSSVVKATVSIGNLTAFCESKGIAVEFKGGLFAANIKLQELNKKNEKAVMANLFKILDKLVENGFDYKIDVHEPKKDSYNENNWIVDFYVTASANKNLENIIDITMNTVNNICLSVQDRGTYLKQNLEMYEIIINGKEYYFRSSSSTIFLRTIFENKIPLASLNFSFSDGINTYDSVSMIPSKLNTSTFTRLKQGWPCLNHSKGDCGYRYGIMAKYFILYNSYGFTLNTDISDFLLSVNKSNFQEVKKSYCKYNNTMIPEIIVLDQFRPGQKNYPIEILYCFKNSYSLEQLSKLSEFKVQPNY